MNKLLSGLAMGLALALAGCVGPTIRPGWTVTERTPVLGNSGTGAVGIHAVADVPLTPGYGAAVGSRCHSSLSEGNARVVFRPGVGAHMRLGFWSTSTNSSGRAVAVPLNLEMDLVLRRVGADRRLSSAERVVLDTLLATSRLRRGDGSEGPGWAQAGADVVAANETLLWNALVESLCVSIVDEPRSDPVRPLLRVEADLSHMCESIQDLGQRAFARLFVDPAADDESNETPCHLSTAEEEGQQQQEQRQETADHPGHRVQRLIGGVLPSPEPVSSTSAVAAAAGDRMTGEFYATNHNVKVGATGEIRMQAAHFGDAGTEEWTLADWEESRICRDPRPDVSEPRISSVNIDGFSFAILRGGEEATHEVRRILGPGGYRFGVEPRSGVTGRQSLAAADLANLHPADVTFTNWRVRRGGRQLWSRPHCARR